MRASRGSRRWKASRSSACTSGSTVRSSPLPGVERFRPQQAPPPDGIENLYLAGDYTRTGWPATMEGAVRSGYLAADAVLARLSPGETHRSFLVDDLPAQWPARLLGVG